MRARNPLGTRQVASQGKGGNGGGSGAAAREAMLNEVNALADAMAETKRSLEAERDELAAALAEARASVAATDAVGSNASVGGRADTVSDPAFLHPFNSLVL